MAVGHHAARDRALLHPLGTGRQGWICRAVCQKALPSHAVCPGDRSKSQGQSSGHVAPLHPAGHTWLPAPPDCLSGRATDFSEGHPWSHVMNTSRWHFMWVCLPPNSKEGQRPQPMFPGACPCSLQGPSPAAAPASQRTPI